MDHRWILPVSEHYARLNAYIQEVGLPWSIEDFQHCDETAAELRQLLGEARGQRVLDCTCGWGTQSVPLARLGWKVTACDISEASLEIARQYANREGVSLEFKLCDLRELAQLFDRQFDWAISFYGLYEIPAREGIRQAVQGIFAALKPGGKCYLQFRDMDNVIEDRPRHEFHGEKRYPGGRVFCIEDHDYLSEDLVVQMYAFLRENENLEPSHYLHWTTETIGVLKNVMRKAELQAMLQEAGFDPVTFLPQPEPWMDVQILAVRPVA